jgi:hypothetical protein
MNWNFIIRLVFILGILGYLIFAQFPMILSFSANLRSLAIVLIIFMVLIFGIYKFLKAGFKINR